MFGVIDIGSNTIRLSLYEIEDKTIKPMMNKKKVAGLASYVDDNGMMSEKGIEKAVCTLNEYKTIIERVGIENLFIFATASLRNIKNTLDVVERIKKETDIDVNVISGEKEGYYDFVGATYKRDISEGIILDIGGGSTEIIFVKDKNVEKVVSIPIGSLNTYRKYVKKLIPTEIEEKKIKQYILEELKKIKINLKNTNFTQMYGIGGSIRGAFKLNRDFFELEDDGDELTRKNIKKLLDIFEEKPQIAISEILEVVPDRIHTIPTGMIILKTIMKFYGCKTVNLCEWGIREGYLIDNTMNKEVIVEEQSGQATEIIREDEENQSNKDIKKESDKAVEIVGVEEAVKVEGIMKSEQIINVEEVEACEKNEDIKEKPIDDKDSISNKILEKQL